MDNARTTNSNNTNNSNTNDCVYKLLTPSSNLSSNML